MPSIDFDTFMALAVFMDELAYREIIAPRSVQVSDRGIVIWLGKASRTWAMSKQPGVRHAAPAPRR